MAGTSLDKMGLSRREKGSDSGLGTQLAGGQLGDAYLETISAFAAPLTEIWTADKDKLAWADEISPSRGVYVIRLITPKMLELRSAAAVFEFGRGRRDTTPEEARAFLEQSVRMASDWYTTTADHAQWAEDASRAFVAATGAA